MLRLCLSKASAFISYPEINNVMVQHKSYDSLFQDVMQVNDADRLPFLIRNDEGGN